MSNQANIEETARTGATVGGEDAGSGQERQDQVPLTGNPKGSFYISFPPDHHYFVPELLSFPGFPF